MPLRLETLSLSIDDTIVMYDNIPSYDDDSGIVVLVEAQCCLYDGIH